MLGSDQGCSNLVQFCLVGSVGQVALCQLRSQVCRGQVGRDHFNLGKIKRWYVGLTNIYLFSLSGRVTGQVRSGSPCSYLPKSGQVRFTVLVFARVRSGQVRSTVLVFARVRSGQVRCARVRPGQVRSGQVRSAVLVFARVRSDQIRSGPLCSGEVRSGQVRSGQVRCVRVSPRVE